MIKYPVSQKAIRYRKREARVISYSTAAERWAGVGPYYAMFPSSFATDIINQYSKPGQHVLDPFAGRASSIHAAATTDRIGLGVEISPVGWLYGKVKLSPAAKHLVVKRLEGIGQKARRISPTKIKSLPPFFRHCFSREVIAFLLAAKKNLRWKTNQTDATVMAFILIYLHGKRDFSLSNQMRQTKAMSPAYSIQWWKERKLKPPKIDPVKFLLKRVEWRYAKGSEEHSESRVILGDAIGVLRKLKQANKLPLKRQFDLLFTSPPYYALANYHYDQWLRLWMLKPSGKVIPRPSKWRGRFNSPADYQVLLDSVFSSAANLLKPRAKVYVRTDARPFTLQATINALNGAFPKKTMTIIRQPFRKATQTALFGDKEHKPGEIDIVLQ